LEVSAKACREAYEDLFRNHRHSTNLLASRVIANSRLRGSDITQLQKETCRAFSRNPIYNLSSSIKDMSDKDVIKKHFYLFNNLFFFGSLANRCMLEMPNEGWKSSGMKGCTSFHFSYRALFGLANQRWKITIWKETEPSRRYRLLKYLGTLLHEMIHVFFDLWACNHISCHPKLERRGATGHGWAWQDTTFALEKACRDKTFLGLDLSTGRAESLAHEVNTAGLNIPPSGELRERWGIESEKVRLIIKELKKRGR
jgi:hypothetical protein